MVSKLCLLWDATPCAFRIHLCSVDRKEFRRFKLGIINPLNRDFAPITDLAVVSSVPALIASRCALTRLYVANVRQIRRVSILCHLESKVGVGSTCEDIMILRPFQVIIRSIASLRRAKFSIQPKKSTVVRQTLT
jgi:hypothetical protein